MKHPIKQILVIAISAVIGGCAHDIDETPQVQEPQPIVNDQAVRQQPSVVETKQEHWAVLPQDDENYRARDENPMRLVVDNPVSTFSLARATHQQAVRILAIITVFDRISGLEF